MPSSRSRSWWNKRLLARLLLLLVAYGCKARTATADEPPRIVFVRDDGESTTSKRLEAELRSLGLTVISRPPLGNSDSRTLLEQAARSERAIAAVQVIAHGTRAELWLVDRVTGKTVLREVTTAGRSRDTSDDTIAVGVAELLRASLMELNAPTQSHGDYPADPQVRELAYTSPPAEDTGPSDKLWLALGSHVEFGVRGIGPSLGGQLGAGAQKPNGLGLEVLAGATFVPALVERDAGKARISSQWFGAAGTLAWEPRRLGLSGRAGLGVLVARVEASGEGAAPAFTQATEATWSAGPYLHAGPAIGSRTFRLRLDAGVLLLLSAPAIHFADESVGVWGLPALFVSMSVEAVAKN